MNSLKKYLLLLFLSANITSEYLLIMPVSEVLFYSVLVISVFYLLINLNYVTHSLSEAPDIRTIIILYLIAQFVLQINIISVDNVLYTITKVIVLIIIVTCIGENFNFYLKKSPLFFSYIILGLIILGLFVNKIGLTGNYQFGFANRNVACTYATAAFAGFIFMKKKLNLIDYACIAFLIIAILYGGSRNALAMCALIIIVRLGFSFKMMCVGVILLVTILYVLPELGIDITAFERLKGTFDGTVAIDREEERETALKMITMRPLTGWGYYFDIPESAGDAIGAHNGYLALIENIGYPCAIAVLFVIGIGTLKRLKLYKLHDNALNYCLAIVVSTLFATNQESYLIGVNQFTTNYFFVAYVLLGFYRKRKQIPNTYRL